MARGSIRRRGNSWSAIVDLPPDPVTGNRRQKRITASTRKEVERSLSALLTSVEQGYTDAGRKTVRTFFYGDDPIDGQLVVWAGWFVTVAPSLRPSTLRRYRDSVRLHVLPLLGSVRLAKLSPADLQRLYNDRLAAGLSPTTVRHIHGIIHRALEDAVKWGMVSRNVADAATAPKRSSVEMATWNAEQASKVFDAAKGSEIEALLWLAIQCGLRRGELLALRWDDIDLNGGNVSIRRTLSRGASSKLEFGEPKTAASKRRVSLSAALLEVVREHRRRQLEHIVTHRSIYEDAGLVFADGLGRPLHPNALNRKFAEIIRRAGLPVIRFHDLRHTCATIMLAQGVHPKIVQELLGHTDISMTMNLYSHVTTDMQQEAADAIDRAISGAREAVS